MLRGQTIKNNCRSDSETPRGHTEPILSGKRIYLPEYGQMAILTFILTYAYRRCVVSKLNRNCYFYPTAWVWSFYPILDVFDHSATGTNLQIKSPQFVRQEKPTLIAHESTQANETPTYRVRQHNKTSPTRRKKGANQAPCPCPDTVLVIALHSCRPWLRCHTLSSRAFAIKA